MMSICLVQVAGYSDKTWLRGKETRVNSEQIEQSVNDSLQRLQTDHLDLLQIHWPDRYLPLFGSGVYDPQKEREGDVSYEEQLQGLEKVIKAGKVSPMLQQNCVACMSMCALVSVGGASSCPGVTC